MNTRTAELLGNQEFITEMLTKSTEEVVDAINANGGEITKEEFFAVVDEAQKILESPEDCELDEEAMDNVAGGGILKVFARALAGTIAGMKGGLILTGGNPLGGLIGGFGGGLVGAMTTK